MLIKFLTCLQKAYILFQDQGQNRGSRTASSGNYFFFFICMKLMVHTNCQFRDKHTVGVIVFYKHAFLVNLIFTILLGQYGYQQPPQGQYGYQQQGYGQQPNVVYVQDKKKKSGGLGGFMGSNTGKMAAGRNYAIKFPLHYLLYSYLVTYSCLLHTVVASKPIECEIPKVCFLVSDNGLAQIFCNCLNLR